MWKYLLAGLAVVGGMILIASMAGDPVLSLRERSPLPSPATTNMTASMNEVMRQSSASIADASRQYEKLRKQVEELQAQINQSGKDVEDIRRHVLAITRDADLARQALTALRRANELRGNDARIVIQPEPSRITVQPEPLPAQ